VKIARWAPLSGVVFVVLWLITFFAFGDDAGESNSDILSWYADSGNHDKQLASFFLILAATMFFLWFASTLRGWLADAEGKAGSMTALGYGAALVAGVMWTIAGVFFMAISFTASDSDEFVVDPNTARVFDNAGYAIWFSGTTIAALLVFATALLALRSGFLPKWLAWVSFVVALTMLVSFAFLPFLIFLGWILVVSILLAWKPVGTEAPAATPAS
jgi:hypothetical protein